METTAAFRGLRCTECGERTEPETDRCPACNGLLVADYDVPALEPADLPHVRGPGRYEPLRPFSEAVTVGLDEGATPLVSVPELAAELDVAAVYVKDEGRNPTGSLADRKLSLAVTAATQRGAERVATPSTGNGAQANAAYAARAGVDSTGFVPSRCPFLNKAMVNVHGGDMRVVEGRYQDAADAFQEADDDWTPVAPGDPFRIEGAASVAFEVLEDLAWTAPDAVVQPTGHGETLVGLQQGFDAATESGLAEDAPRLYAAQPATADAVAEAWAQGQSEPARIEHPDTIVGPLEVPNPAAGEAALGAIGASDGGAVSVEDEETLRGAVDCCELGPEVGATGGTAVGAARTLSARGAFDADDVVVLVNPVAGSKEADLLRSHLMSRGL
ncbi:pyridoxal-phosphate dependent enzyme [Halomicroarcula sp. GCM10025324]|uniref:threonine synthase n=1 Tax=Haloarcula TaxID=2237 RepID=UPI0023E7E095|nr:pyridoxal-phosphate dependent enzyme [Halomicroarcula sp. ZS-22-S1]